MQDPKKAKVWGYVHSYLPGHYYMNGDTLAKMLHHKTVFVVAVVTSAHAYQCMYERHLHIWAERICKLHIFEPQRVEFFQKRFKEVWQFARCRLIVPYTSFLEKMHRLSQCVDVCNDNELVSVMISGILLISDSIRPTVEPTSRLEPTGSSPLIKLFLSTSLKISFDLQIFIPKIKISKSKCKSGFW